MGPGVRAVERQGRRGGYQEGATFNASALMAGARLAWSRHRSGRHHGATRALQPRTTPHDHSQTLTNPHKPLQVLPKLWCHCDRYWGFLRKCRFPFVPNMRLPFNCPQDALFDPMRWNSKMVCAS